MADETRRVECPCGARITVPAGMPGELGKCPACGRPLPVPQDGSGGPG